MRYCPLCVEDGSLGAPSLARWAAPDGRGLCSLHFVRVYGHGQPMLKLEITEPPPAAPKPPKVGTVTVNA